MLAVQNMKAPPIFVPPVGSRSTRIVLIHCLAPLNSIITLTLTLTLSPSSILFHLKLGRSAQSVTSECTKEIGFIIVPTLNVPTLNPNILSIECKPEFNLVDSGITASNNKLSRFPLLLSGEKEFVYESCTPLSSSSGSVEGSFTFVSGRLSVEVPPAICEDCYKRVMNEFMKQSKGVLYVISITDLSS